MPAVHRSGVYLPCVMTPHGTHRADDAPVSFVDRLDGLDMEQHLHPLLARLAGRHEKRVGSEGPEARELAPKDVERRQHERHVRRSAHSSANGTSQELVGARSRS